MWLYLPEASTASPCVPAEEASTSESNWQSQALASSVWWRGKPSPLATWSKRCAKVSWLQRLCGVMPEPSRAEGFADLWMASLAASRASPTAKPDSAAALKTTAISGRPPGRILVQSGAWWVLIENVSGMLSSGGAERVWRDLQRLGFAVEGGLFTAAEVGASHERARVFILGVADRNFFRQQSVGELDCGSPAGRQAAPRRGHTDRRREDLADADGPRGNAGRRGQGTRGRPIIAGDGVQLADAQCDGRREGAELLQPLAVQSEPALRGEDVVHAGCAERRPEADGGHVAYRRMSGRLEGTGRPSEPDDHLGLFAPGPGELQRWRDILDRSPELEPSFRRVADGLASRLDIARVDRLRLLGNGVVSLEAAYALRTLATDLARRSAGAAFLVRMMGDA